MAFLKESLLREKANRFQKTASASFRYFSESTYQANITVFLSHSHKDKELVEGLSKSSLKKENIELLNRAYTLRYGVYKQLRYDQKVRKMAYLLLAILIAIGFLVYRYGILPTYLIIPTFSFVYVITLIFLAWREEKKMG